MLYQSIYVLTNTFISYIIDLETEKEQRHKMQIICKLGEWRVKLERGVNMNNQIREGPNSMSYADLLDKLIEENKLLTAENERLKRELEEVKKENAASGASASGES